MTTKNIIIGIIIVVVLCSGFFIGRCTNGSRVESIDERVALRDTIISREKDRVVLYERLLEEKDRSLQILHEKDSLTAVHSKEIEEKYKKVNETIKRNNTRIDAVSNNNDSLRFILSTEF